VLTDRGGFRQLPIQLPSVNRKLRSCPEVLTRAATFDRSPVSVDGIARLCKVLIARGLS